MHVCHTQGSAVVEGGSSTEGRVRAHGALMLVAFVVLMPLGVLLSRHRCVGGSVWAGATWCAHHGGRGVHACTQQAV